MMHARAPILLVCVVAMAAALGLAGCGKDPTMPAPGSMEPDRYLFEMGNRLIREKNWITAREYYKRLVDTYPGSPHRQDAKLGIGDTYLGEGRADSLVLAVNEYREFLQFFPLNPRADYAQSRVCLATSKQMLSPQRDQTATLETIAECDRFLAGYPSSQYRAEVTKIRRDARDRISKWELDVGLQYYRMGLYEGSAGRLRKLLADDPEYARRDAAYFHLGEMLFRAERRAEALPYFDRVVTEFPKSDYAERAAERIKTIKGGAGGS